MRNTSESPDANEQVQAKPATTKSRAGTRSKTESALLGTGYKACRAAAYDIRHYN